MRKTVSVMLAGMFGLTVMAAAPASYAGDDMQMKDLPAKVQQAVKTAVGDGEIEEIEKDKEDGRVIYEVEYERGGEDFEMKVSEDGKVLKNEED